MIDQGETEEALDLLDQFTDSQFSEKEYCLWKDWSSQCFDGEKFSQALFEKKKEITFHCVVASLG